MRRLSIRVRLAFAHTIVLGTLLSLCSVAFYRVAAARLYSQLDKQLEEHSVVLRPFFNVSQAEVSWLVDKKNVEQFSSLIAHAVFDGQGHYLDGSALAKVFIFSFTDAARQALEKREPTWETLSLPYGHRVRALNSTITGSDGRVYVFRVGILLDQPEDDLRQLGLVLTLLVPLVTLIGGATGWWMAGRALRPVAEITGTAQRITASNLAQRLPLRGTGDELDRLSATLNQMIARLEHSFEQMSQFISNVSHELRTPLAALRGTCEVALRTAQSEKEYREVISSSIEDLDRLSRTVSNLLSLARAETGQLALNRRPENLTELVRDAVESTRMLAAERGICIECETEADVTAEVDAEHLLRLLVNLLDNAIKYNRTNGRIEVALRAVDSWLVVSVRDSGVGIPAEDLPRIFDRFYRGRADGEESAGGTGLGLSLARWTAGAHGGRIEVESQLGQGSTFRVWLPQNAPKDSKESLTRFPSRRDYARASSTDEGALGPTDARAWAMNPMRRSTTVEKHLVRWSYWLGIACALVALIWRGLVAVGIPERITYADRAIGYAGFFNGALLFLLIATATASYVSATTQKT